MSTYLSICGESYGVVRAAGHFRHPLVDEIGGDQGGGQAVIGGAVSQLTVAIVTPGINLSIYR